MTETAQAADVQPVEIDWTTKAPPREWIADGWIPGGALSALFGPAGGGKSLLALQIAAAAADPEDTPMLPWIAADPGDAGGGEPEDARPAANPVCRGGGRVLIASWQDGADEYARRWRLLHAAGAVRTEQPPAEISLLDMRESGPLRGPAHDGGPDDPGEWTPAGRRFLAALPGFRLAVVDPIPGAYACSEAYDAPCGQFVYPLYVEAQKARCAVLLVGTPAPDRSPVWRNAARAVLALEQVPPTIFDVKRPTPRLRLDKANYAQSGGCVWLVGPGDGAWKATDAYSAEYAADGGGGAGA